MKTLSDVLAAQERTRQQAADALAEYARKGVATPDVPKPRNARDPRNRYSDADPLRDPRETPTAKGTVAPEQLRDPTADELKILAVLALDTAACARFRKERGIKPVLS
jgi:hypothetical protein